MRKKFEVEIPDGTHLDFSRDTHGARRGTLRDDVNNDLVGQAELFEVDDDWDEDWDEDSESEGPDSLLGLAMIAGAGVAAFVGYKAITRAVESGRQKRAEQQAAVEAPVPSPPPAFVPSMRALPPPGWCEDPTGRIRWWDGQQWTEHVRISETSDIATPAEAARSRSHSTPSTEVSAASAHARVSMSSAEWQERARAMLLARAFSEEQRRLLANARIEDADAALLEQQHDLAGLTTQQFSDRISAILDERSGPPEPLALPASGWYDDGFGDLRWWNSRRWTEHVQPATVEAQVHAAAFPSAAPGWYDDGSGRQRWWNGRHWA